MSKPKSQEATSLAVRLLAELGIIVLGVLIALWADGWVSDRQDREKETARILALRENIVASQALLADSIETADRVMADLQSMAYWTDLENFESEKMGEMLKGFLEGPRFTPEMNVYDDLESSGELALLTSDSLRQSLARMRAALLTIEISQQDLLTVQQLNFDRFAVENLAISRVPFEVSGLKDLPTDAAPPLPDLRLIRNLTLFKLDLISQIKKQYENADATFVQVLKEIDAFVE